MSIETSANPVGPQQAGTVPALRTFQTLESSLGRISENVNLFRGNVSFPLPLLSMENRGGLQVDVSLAYQSDILHSVTTWNLESPTGIVGLGWQMPYAMIERDLGSAISPYDDPYYLSTTDGGRSRLFLVDRAADVWTFESENFDFSIITYQPAKEIWTIIDSGGQTRIFGADVSAGQSSAALRYLVKWGGVDGNWSDSSVQLGQSRTPVSWNLSAVRNAWGEEIRFTYTQFADDEIRIGGPGGLTYTRAAYLASIADPSGRIVTFNYSAKIYDDTIREYQPSHTPTDPSGPYAWQDRYETRFLDSIRLDQTVSGLPEEVFTIRLDYTVENLVSPGIPGDARYLYKRYLRGITTVNAAGKLLPGLRFDYYTDPGAQTHTGALRSVTYPDGGVASYTYTLQPVTGSALDRTFSASDSNWIPGTPSFWFGPDYIVITHYDELNSNLLTVSVHDWNGRWLDAVPLATNLPFSLDPATLQVNLQSGFFALSAQVSGSGSNGALFAWAMRRAYGNYGVWTATSLPMPDFPAANTKAYVAAGENFVIAAVSGVSQILRYTWDPRTRQWIASQFDVTTPAGGDWSLAARDNFFTLCQFQPGAPLTLTLHYCDLATLEWTDVETPLDNLPAYIWQDDLPKLSWTLSDTFAAATWITSGAPGPNTFNYQVNLYLWDRTFTPLPSPPPIVGTNIPADTVEPVFVSLADGSLLGNAGNLLRFDGIQWNAGSLGTFDEGTAMAQFAFGADLAVGVSDAKGTVAVYDPYNGVFNQVVLAAGTGGPSNPTINPPYVTVRNLIYQQMPSGDLQLLDQTLPLDAVIISNQAPAYFAYGRADGSSFVWLTQNGVLAPQPQEVTGSIFPPPSASAPPMTGPFAFATWSGVSYQQPDTLTLHRVLFGGYAGPVSTFVVSAAAISDGLGNVSTVAFDYNTPGASGTVNPFGLSTQFSQVKSTMGVANDGSAPYGSSLYSFYDGITPPGSSGDILYSFLSGMLRQVDGFDSSGKQVARTARIWQTPQTRVDPVTEETVLLIGGYTRLSSSVETIFDVNPSSPTTQAPLDVPTVLTYNEANGRMRSKQTQFYSSVTDSIVQVFENYLYAYEQYPPMAQPDVNQLVSVAQKTTVSGGAVTRIDATTWTNSNPPSAWVPFRSFRALAADSTLSSDEWSNSTLPSPTAWRRLWQVSSRGRSGDVQEYIAGDGLTNSVVVDSSGQLTLGIFGDASLAAQQALYLGFEPGEILDGWTLSGSLTALEAAIQPGNSYTGTQALVLGGSGVPASSPLERTLTVTETVGRTYVLTCWVSTPAGFASLPGTAAWAISGAVSASLAIPETSGQWQYISLLFDLPASQSPQTVAITLTNTKNAAVLADNMRMSPLVSGFSANVYDLKLLLPSAVIQSNGATVWTVRGDFDEFLGEVDSLMKPSKMSDVFLSRRGNGGVFSPALVNSRLDITVRGWGSYQSFNQGDIFAGSWISSTPAQWTTSESALHHLGDTPGVIQFNGYPDLSASAVPVFGAAIRVQPEAPLTAPLGMQFTGGQRLQWSPALATWTLLDSNGATLATAPIRASLTVPFATYASQLNQSTLPPDFPAIFSAAGLPLASGSKAVAIAADQQWRVQDAVSVLTYYLVRSSADPTLIQVVTFPRQWTVLCIGSLLALFADGGRALTYSFSAALPAGLAFFATDVVGFSNALFFTEAEVSLSFLNADSEVVQEQIALPTAGSLLELVGKATFYDPLGRDVVHSQGAAMDATLAGWGLYDPSLAAYDAQTLIMTGLVASQNPDSGSFPYWRTRFENSPLGRKAEIGLPGQPYAIQPAGVSHTTRFTYCLNDGSWNYNAGKFAQTTTLDPDGRVQIQLLDERRLLVAGAALRTAPPAAPQWDITRRTFSAAGLLATSTSPMGWTDVFQYDFLGNSIRASRANEGDVLSMYDSADRLRFQQDARGAQSPNYIKYWKYDALSRVVEEGFSEQSWPGSLAKHVDDQSFPSATPSNQYTYDLMQPPPTSADILNALGKLTQVVCGNELSSPTHPADSFQSTEKLFYDVYGAVTQQTLTIAGSSDVYTTCYTNNNQGEITGIQYPGSGGLAVGYALDLLGRVQSVSIAGNPCAVYAYNANGSVSEESFYLPSGQQVGATRYLSYGPPGWMTDTAGTGFSETTSYAVTADGATPSYNGSPSLSVVAPRANRGEVSTTYAYDPIGRLASAISRTESGQFTYDNNSNLLTVGSSANTYTTATRDEVQTTTGVPAPASYTYDPSGETISKTSAAPPGDLTFGWDCFRNLLVSATLGSPPTQGSLSVRYGHRGRRIQKTFTPSGLATVSRLYLRGAGDDALVELNGTDPVRQYVFGPIGMCMFQVGATPYFASRDRLGSIRAVLDSSTNLVAGFDYTPYGLVDGAPLGSNPAILPYMYIARELDETLLYDFRARAYDPRQGRFISPDPEHQFISPYVYAGSNPLLLSDPDGRFAFLALLIPLFEAIAAAAEAIATTISAASSAIALTTAGGAAVGFVIGIVQGAETVAAGNFSGAEAAGVFFGTVVLSTVGGALSGGAAAVTGAFVEGALVTAAALTTGVVIQGGIAAAQSAAQAALVGDDPGEAAWKNAIAGGTAFLGGSLVSAGAKAIIKGVDTTARAIARGVASGAAGGAIGSGVTAGLNDEDEGLAFSDVLQGIAFGVLGGIFPEVVSYKQEQLARFQEHRTRMIGVGNDISYGTFNDDL